MLILFLCRVKSNLEMIIPNALKIWCILFMTVYLDEKVHQLTAGSFSCQKLILSQSQRTLRIKTTIAPTTLTTFPRPKQSMPSPPFFPSCSTACIAVQLWPRIASVCPEPAIIMPLIIVRPTDETLGSAISNSHCNHFLLLKHLTANLLTPSQ